MHYRRVFFHDESRTIDTTWTTHEAEIIGVSDHLAQEIPLLIELVSHGKIDVSGVITKTVPLEAGAVNDALDSLERFDSQVRMVVVP